jgi:hydroxymethylpyrimidine/phosphomethylpyrimidine kinase
MLLSSRSVIKPKVLVIAGTDSSGGAGLTRDVAILTDHGCIAVPVVTAVTAQSDQAVHAIHLVPAEIVRAQIKAAFSGGQISAIKIGMLGNRSLIEAVAQSLPDDLTIPIVLDPVLVSSSGKTLLDDDAHETLIRKLLPRVSLLTPNIPEAAVLSGSLPAQNEAAQIAQALRLQLLGPQSVLIKGGHSSGNECVDILVSARQVAARLSSPRLPVTLRGTGCAMASAIAALLAHGQSLPNACHAAKQYLDLERLNPPAPCARSPNLSKR